jgi:hypothetical protein
MTIKIKMINIIFILILIISVLGVIFSRNNIIFYFIFYIINFFKYIYDKMIGMYTNFTYSKIKLVCKTLRTCYKSYTISALIIKLSVYTAGFLKSGHMLTFYPILGIVVSGMLDEALNKDPNLQRLLNSDPDLKAEAGKNNGYFSESQKKWIKYLCLTAAVGLVVGITW